MRSNERFAPGPAEGAMMLDLETDLAVDLEPARFVVRAGNAYYRVSRESAVRAALRILELDAIYAQATRPTDPAPELPPDPYPKDCEP